MQASISYRTGGPSLVVTHISELVALYERDFVEPALQGNSLFSADRFRQKLLNEYLYTPHFRIVIAKANDQLIGFAYGCSLPPDTQWWQDVKESLSPELMHETGQRTFALLDIVVRREYRGQGIGSSLHSQLLRGRHEQRATLLSSPAQQPAYAIFQRWGYQQVATAEPTEDGTLMHVLLRQIPS